ncbi:multiple epidermal growth factor-like domains protein 10 isoform X2 [Ruditapes philippinarum]|uniref:multiple epidermal growth factor-like domains protein 10 isoform X2 n=1 Tax=Ruditapes philippinarum TaxID=129788 RepID=UPI00295B5A7C|nr:multiple epidermal growth factor-like domains protein 10 isoform X2 [Ruditapes philippinarum]
MESVYLCMLLCVICAVVNLNTGAAASSGVIDKPCNDTTESTVCTLKNSKCISKKCGCKSGYKNKDDTCLKILGTSCSTTSDCNDPPNADCLKSKCSCKATYVEENGVCPKAAGQNCSTITDCGLNASCDKVGSPCKCKDGFVASSGLCAKPSSAVSSKIALSTVCILMMLNVIYKLL